ncbi:VOC family protein [Gluconacetobacter entanii]|uniref:VOC family protein n=1 Tax=Gluconacetobacter entanii TaxID=108528 RepID=A0ABT3K170_9PROT|nr:VOC family protein [Gluconacetobacter entanii]MCE2580538.1 VOC family protein [Komagataeibacter sp. FNDCR1]MCW4589140.1 VOC family protein [Gluconacetobacter entanii]MCW4592659.1 VOC family protein [Gluconacetobacter entanii]
MKFASTRLIAADINTMVAFYELVTEQPAEWLAPQFAEIVTPGATLAIGSAETVALFREGTAEPGANRTAILEFRVDDVDAVFARLKNKVDVVIEPKLLPWGNRTAQFRDPEGTIISLFTPLTKAARARFGTRRQRVANRSVISIDNIQESGGEANDLVLGTNLKKPVI